MSRKAPLSLRHASGRSRRQRGTIAGRVATTALLSCGVALGACGSTDDAPPSDDRTLVLQSGLQAFDSCDSLDGYLTDVMVDTFVNYIAYGGGVGRTIGVDFAQDEAAPGGDSAGGRGENSGAAPTDFTGTNNQEVGVDEADSVKSTGTHMYVATESTVRVVATWPADQTAELATIPVEGHSPQLLLTNDRLVVMTQIYATHSDGGSSGAGRAPQPEPDIWRGDERASYEAAFTGTRLAIYDVSDPATPTHTATHDIQGRYLSARSVGASIYLVSGLAHDDYNELYERMAALNMEEIPWDASEAERSAAALRIARQIRPTVATYVRERGRDALMPDVISSDAERRELLACTDMMRPLTRTSPGLLTLVALNPLTGAAPAGVAVVADGTHVYASQQSLYIAQDSRWWSWGLDDDRVARTQIHGFTLGDGKPQYAASGEVDGWLLNQFSMSEYDGHLRVATTDRTSDGWMWGGRGDIAGGDDAIAVDAGGAVTEPGGNASGGGDRSDDGGSDGAAGEVPPSAPDAKRIIQLETGGVDANNVFVLRREGAELRVVGGIRGMAPDERIYAVRFMGEMGYVVTFRDTDPLFTIDLSDPTAPELLGELHIPGFSTYMHPIDDGHLMAIGRDGDDVGNIGGVHLQIFDVTDPTTPTRSHHHVLETGGYSYSAAEYDHRAFTYHAARGLLAIPLSIYAWDGTTEPFSGIIVFRVDTSTGFEEVGRVAHDALVRDADCVSEMDDACMWNRGSYVWMQRAMLVEDYLFAISNIALTASHLSDLGDVIAHVRLD